MYYRTLTLQDAGFRAQEKEYTIGMSTFRFKNLIVWKKAISLTVILTKISEEFPSRFQSSFGDQLRRAGLSMPNNIAEGNGRKSERESNNFYNIAKGSAYECISILEVASQLSLINWTKFNRDEIESLAEEICRMLHSLMNRPPASCSL